jgi:uncharacterized caspase-like protein
MFRYLRHERLKLQDRMHKLSKISLFLAILAIVFSSPAGAAPSEKRLALVIGNSSYRAKALATPVNDAALIAQTLQAAGFDVMGARDLDEDLLRQTFSDFIESVAKAGPDTVAAVYFAGYALQLEGENYLVPIDADITTAPEIPLRALRLSELTHALAALRLKATFLILDAARASPFSLSGQPPASGLAWVEPETNMLIAFSATPGTVSPDVREGYGPYAKALAEMIREGGLTLTNLFDRVRLRVNELTKGAQVPWDTSKIETKFTFFARAPGAPPRADSPEHTAWMRSQPMRSLGAHDAYMVALTRDTFDGYADFLADYWHDPMTKRVRALLAARREAITWLRTYQANVPDAYWTYMERYPNGSHVADAARLLNHLGATMSPPARFTKMEYDVPPPFPDELEYIERTVLVFDDPTFAFELPQPSPIRFLEPPPLELLALEPPVAHVGAYILPSPKFVSLPAYVEIPADVVAPPNSFIFHSARKSPFIVVPTRPDGQAVSTTISPLNENNPAEGPRLPPSVEKRATLINSRKPPRVVNPVVREEIKVPQRALIPAISSVPPWATYDLAAVIKVSQNPPAPTLSPIPFWASYDLALEEIKVLPSSRSPTVSLTTFSPPDNKAPGDPGIELPTLARDSEPPTPVPPMLAAPPTGVPLRTPRAPMLSARAAGSMPLPIPRPPTLAAPSAGVPLQTRRAPTLSSQMTGSIPLPNSRPTTFVSPTRNRPKPVTSATSMSSTTASPPKPQRKLCPIVNGTRSCG